MRPATILGFASALLLAFGSTVLADDPPQGKDKPAQEAPSFMPKPLPEHKLLAQSVGVWDATMKTYFGGPESKPTESKGVETSTLMAGGLWLIGSFKGDFGGQPFEGTGVTGYDPKKKKYIGTWADNMTPELTLMEGTYDEKTKTMTMTGDATGEDGKPMSMQYTTEQKDPNTRLFTISVKGDQTQGRWVKMMEIHYQRRDK